MKIKLIGKSVQMKKKTVIFMAVVVILIISVIGFLISSANNIAVEFDDPLTNEITTPKTSDEIPEEISHKQMIQVYVTGCVKNPGIYEIEKGQIINDAITAAGGFTEDADININLVYKLYENVTLRIKSINETSDSFRSTGIEIIEGASGIIADPDQQSLSGSGTLININTANASLLSTLPGVGASTAKKIIEYREKNGDFKKIEDIMKVPGIKESKFSQIKTYITAD